MKAMIPFAILSLFSVAVYFSQKSKPAASPLIEQNQSAAIEMDPSRFLIRPFYTSSKQVAVALDGGEMPIPNGQVPSITIGKNVLRSVHLAWLHDWTKPECQTLYKNLQALYASEQGASLPALRIHLNPVFSDDAGKALHHAMLQSFFRSRTRNSYQILANEISTKALVANPQAIRNRMEILEPVLLEDWDAPPDWLELDIEKTFSIAEVQRKRNTTIVGPEPFIQLSSMQAILPPSATQEEMITFIQNADKNQRTWLKTLPSQSIAVPPVTQEGK